MRIVLSSSRQLWRERGRRERVLLAVALVLLTTLVSVGSVRHFFFHGRTVSFSAAKSGIATTPDNDGYWLVQQDGGVFPHGDAGGWGSMGGSAINAPMVGMAATPDGNGYWLVGADGGVFAFGDAGGYGSIPGQGQHVSDVVAIASTPSGHGYYIVEATGGLWPYGDAAGYGCLPCSHVGVNDVTAFAVTPDGGGFWFAESNGGVWPYGDAAGFGNITGQPHQPVRAILSVPNGQGYWLVASDGGTFPFNADGFGSLPGIGVNVSNIVGAALTHSGHGMILTGSDGAVYTLGDQGLVQ